MERWVTRGSAELLAELREEILAPGRRETRPVELDGRRLYLKARALRGKARLRHAVRWHLLRLSLPRLREFENLRWLRAGGFGAPRPLLAGAVFRNGIPRLQFLATEEIAGARTLDEVLASGPEPWRGPALELLATELARLHGLGFVHRDLFPRNLLLRPSGEGLELFFLDAWRGGPGPGLRGPRYDLDCFLRAGEGRLTPAERARFLDAYRSARGAGKPHGPGKIRKGGPADP